MQPLEKLIDIYNGQRCFIIGNAPDIKYFNLNLLKNDIVFTVNKGYLLSNYGLLNKNYHVVNDPNIWDLYYSDFLNIYAGVKIFSSKVYKRKTCYRNLSDFVGYTWNINLPISRYNSFTNSFENNFPLNPDSGWCDSWSVVIDATIIAYFMGFKKIYWLGISFNYDISKSTHFYGDIRQGTTDEKNLLKLVSDDELREKKIENSIYFVNNFLKHKDVHIYNLNESFKFFNLLEFKHITEIF